MTMSNYSQMDHMKMNQASMNKMDHPMNMKNMEMEMKPTSKYTKFWEGVIADTLHCGAGYSSADLIGSWIFYFVIPFTLFYQKIFGEWLFDYILALLTGIAFQYAAISPMLHQTGLKIWFKALKIDFLSLTAW